MPNKYKNLTERLPSSDLLKSFETYNGFSHCKNLDLMIADLYFLVKYANPITPKLTCVIADAAGCEHVEKLVTLFPNIIFHLYDEYTINITKSPKIHIYHKLFTNADASAYNGYDKQLLFISNIHDINDFNKETEQIRKYMKIQSNWVKLMNPTAASLKFVLPNQKAYVQYLDGEIILPQYGALSLISRIFVTNCVKIKIYECNEYNEKLNYFNIHIRNLKNHYSSHDKILTENHLKPIYDTTVAFNIIDLYLSRYSGIHTQQDTVKLLINIINFMRVRNDSRDYAQLFSLDINTGS